MNAINDLLAKRKAKEKAYCAKCTNIEDCQYTAIGNRGFQPVWAQWDITYPFVRQCTPRKIWNESVRTARAFGESGIPRAFSTLRLSDFTELMPGPALLAAQAIEAGLPKQVYLQGPKDSCKTSFVCAIANALVNKGTGVQYVPITDFLLRLRYTSEAFEANLERYITVPLLIVEDLGVERATEYSREQLEMVLRRRRVDEKSTIVTSRLTPDKIAEHYEYQGRLQETLEAMDLVKI